MFKRLLSAFTCAVLVLAVFMPQNVVANTEFEVSNGVLTRYNGTKGSVVIPGNVTAIANGAFSFNSFIVNVTIPASVKSIGDFAFNDCLYLSTINMGEGTTSIGTGAFKNCYSLKSITLPNSIRIIGNNAFGNCVSLTSVTFGSGVQSIGASAFENCIGLTTINIPKNLTSIGINAFAGCVGLQDFETASDVVGFEAYEGVLYSKDGRTLVAYPQARTGAYSLRPGTTSIAGGAFSCAYGLTDIRNADTVENVGDFAFYNCIALKKINLPNAKSIGMYAFNACKTLRSVNIGGANIGEYAFANNDALKIAIVGNGSTTILEGAFSGCNKLTRIVLPSSISFIGSNILSKSPNAKVLCDTGSTVYKFMTNIAERTCAPISVPSEWAADVVNKAGDLKITEMQIDYKANTTRATFCYAAINFLEKYYDKGIEEILTERGLSLGTFKDTTDEDILAANALGIVNGFAGSFDPNGYLTREQAATLISNIMTNELGIYVEIDEVIEYKDADQVSDWAVEAVNTVSALNIMSGSDGAFNPKGYYTHEQSIITLLRLLDVIKETAKPIAQ